MARKFDSTYEVRYVDTDANKVKFVAFDNHDLAQTFADALDFCTVEIVKVRHGLGDYNTVEVLS